MGKQPLAFTVSLITIKSSDWLWVVSFLGGVSKYYTSQKLFLKFHQSAIVIVIIAHVLNLVQTELFVCIAQKIINNSNKNIKLTFVKLLLIANFEIGQMNLEICYTD